MLEMYLIHNLFVSKFCFGKKQKSILYKSGSTQTFISQLTNATRLSCGLGVVLNLMNVARLELNYTLPLWTQVHDRLVYSINKNVYIVIFIILE
jgi:hypothetical protein